MSLIEASASVHQMGGQETRGARALYSILYWSRVLDRNVGSQPVQTKEDRAEREGVVFRLKLGTANVTTLYPREEGSVSGTKCLALTTLYFKREVWQCPLADFSWHSSFARKGTKCLASKRQG